MATINGAFSPVSRGVVVATWSFATPASGDVGSAFDAAGYPDKTVAIEGLASTNTSAVVIEGVNIATGTYDTLNNPQDSALSFTDNQVEVILENPLLIRPRIDTATTSQGAVTVVITANSGKK
ncbi:MAG: hypothetical protein ACR2RF_25520 [Geminicoccaceae bacterium]